MKIQQNKDFLEYKNVFLKGFSISEIVSLVIALSCEAVVMFFCYRYLHIPPDKAWYLGVPAMLPAFAVGFIRIQDHATILQYLQMIYDTYRCRQLSFCGEEFPRQRVFYMTYPKERADRRHNRKGGKSCPS